MVSAHSTAVMHLIERFAQQGGPRTMVIGHRGGFFGPENSMKTFKAAIDHKLEGIEFDVSLDINLANFMSLGLAKQGQSANGSPWRQRR